MSFGALLDACVLVPVSLTDTLLRAADAGLYRPPWSERILAEMRAAVLAVHPDISPAQVDARIAAMQGAFEDATVTGWEPLVEGIVLGDDPDDRHVVAAALRGGADAVVTANVRDFPVGAVCALGLHVVGPDDFLLDLADLHPPTMVDVIRSQARATQHPPLTPHEVLDALARAGVPRFAAWMRTLVGGR